MTSHRKSGLAPAFVALAAIVLSTLPIQRTSAQMNDALPRRALLPTPFPTASLPAPPTVAPGYRAPQAEPTNPGIIGVTQNPFVGIALQDAIGMALLKNPNLAVSASNARIARYRVVEAKANFDATLHVEPATNFSVTPPENLFSRAPE